MAEEKPAFHEEILLLAEKIGEMADRLNRIEAEHAAQAAPLEAVKGSQDAALKSLEAAIVGIRALNFHVLDNNLGAVSDRVAKVEKAAKEEASKLAVCLEEIRTAIKVFRDDTSKQLSAANGARHELAIKHESSAKEFAQRCEALKGEIATLQRELIAKVDSARKEFATPATLNPVGKYQPGRLYSRLDLVEFNGSSYLSNVDNNGDQPGAKAKNWQLVARRGAAAGGGGSAIEPASLQTLSDGATITWDLINPVARVTLGGNRTLAVQNIRAGGTYILHVIQDSNGSRTLTWPSSVKWPGDTAPTLTTTASKRDIITFVSDGTYLFGSYVQVYPL